MLIPKKMSESIWSRTRETTRPRSTREQQIALKRLGAKPSTVNGVVLDD